MAKKRKVKVEQQEMTFDGQEALPEVDGNGEEQDSETVEQSPGTGVLRDMIDSNFLQYASYVICERAIPNLVDGLKPVQRRILHALHENDDGRFTKVANVVGNAMQYHPHGDASIGDALVNLTNKRYLIEGQGNFGNIYTGDVAAAPRYIECRLTDLAREEVFADYLTEMVPSYDGRRKEPVVLPSRLPLLLMLGADGIAVGLATKILPHNFTELLEAEIAVLKKQKFTVLPDFPQGGVMDASEYEDGEGSVKVRARIEESDRGSLIVTGLPFGTTTESLIASIEDAARRNRVPVKSISDFTSEHVEIELVLKQGTDPAMAMKKLYAFSSCEVSLSSNIMVIHERRPRRMTVTEVIKENTRYLLKVLKGDLAYRRNQIMEEIHARTLARIFIEERIYKKIEECRSQDEVFKAVEDGLALFRGELNRDVTRKDIEKLLTIPIRRISLFDIEKNKKDIEVLLGELASIEKNLANLTRYAIRTIKGLIKKYGDQYPRRTEISEFRAVEVKKLTATELKIFYDRKTGYVGTKVDGDEMLQCSSYDKVLLMWKDGRYEVMVPPDKFFADKNLLYCATEDRHREMTVVYTSMDMTYVKRFTTGGTIMNKEYLCTLPDSRVLLLQEGVPEAIYAKYKPAKGQRIHQQVFYPEQMPVKGVKARGNQMTSKKIDKLATSKPRWWKGNDNPPGVLH